jgi:hypothetical protein
MFKIGDANTFFPTDSRLPQAKEADDRIALSRCLQQEATARELDLLRDALRQAEARELAALAKLLKFTWQPIETAPRDRVILLYRPIAISCRQVAPGKWDDNEFARHPKGYWQSLVGKFSVREDRDTPPTHWMDLPEPPAEVTS